MIVSETLNPADIDNFRTFVGGMLEEWRDASSLQADNSCCPDRNLVSVLEQFERAAHNDGSLIVAKDLARHRIVGALVVEYGPRWLRNAEAHLLNIHPDYRRNGCARKLIGSALCELRRRRVKKLRFQTWDGNQPALSLFQSAGAHTTCCQSGQTTTTETHLPMVLSTLNDVSVDEHVRMGRFRASATPGDGLTDLEFTVAGYTRNFMIIPS